MSIAKTIALAFGGLVVYNLFTKANALGSLSFYPGGVRNIHFDGPVPVLEFGLVVHNTSNQKFNIKSMTGDVFAAQGTSEKIFIGSISSFSTQSIMPNSQQTIWIDVRLQLIGVVNDLIRVVEYGNFSMKLSIDGKINIDNYQLPLQTSFNVP